MSTMYSCFAMKNAAFVSFSLGLFMMLRDSWNALPISYNKQWMAGSEGQLRIFLSNDLLGTSPPTSYIYPKSVSGSGLWCQLETPSSGAFSQIKLVLTYWAISHLSFHASFQSNNSPPKQSVLLSKSISWVPVTARVSEHCTRAHSSKYIFPSCFLIDELNIFLHKRHACCIRPEALS
jgi:hypothetical protein